MTKVEKYIAEQMREFLTSNVVKMKEEEVKKLNDVQVLQTIENWCSDNGKKLVKSPMFYEIVDVE